MAAWIVFEGVKVSYWVLQGHEAESLKLDLVLLWDPLPPFINYLKGSIWWPHKAIVAGWQHV
jgi:hypothetical protein